MAAQRRNAAEVIGYHLGWDVAEVKAGRYQSTRYANPAVYVCGEIYFCAPAAGRKAPEGFDWVKVATEYGRDVYSARD